MDYSPNKTAAQKDMTSLSVPWDNRDAWIGAAFLFVWIFLTFSSIFILRGLNIDMDWGMVISLAELVLLIPVWWLAIRKYDVGWRFLGLKSFQPEMLALGIGLMALSFGFNFLYTLFLRLFDLRVQPDLAPVLAKLESPWIFLLGGAVIAPIVEEIFFRGFIFAGFRKRYGWKAAALISSALFAVIHFQPTAVIPIFLLGLIFAYLYHRSESIWPGIIMHVVTNSLALGAAYVAAKTGILR